MLRAWCVGAGAGLEAPPEVSLERRWEVADTEAVGSVVTRVRVSGGDVTFGLEKDAGWNIAGTPPDSRPLPFRIDLSSGVVYTNQSLQGRVSLLQHITSLITQTPSLPII